MNFFKLYIGDYQRDTASLSIAEHGAYLLMLQHYYATEAPLPSGKDLHRMLRAQDKSERDAIDTVARKFWTATDAGLVNKRADDEIGKASAQASTNARIASEREAKRKAARMQHESCNEPSTNRATNGQPNQTPDTRHQTPDENTRTATAPEVARVVSPGSTDPPEPEPPGATAAGRTCRAMKAAGTVDVNPGHPELLALLEAGATEAEFVGAAQAATARGKGFAYAIGTLKRQRVEAAKTAQAVHRGPMPVNGQHAEPAWRAEQRARVAEFAGPAAAKRPTTTATAEVVDVAARLVG